MTLTIYLLFPPKIAASLTPEEDTNRVALQQKWSQQNNYISVLGISASANMTPQEVVFQQCLEPDYSVHYHTCSSVHWRSVFTRPW